MTKPLKKITYQEKGTIVDPTTGEIKEIDNKREVRVAQEENYIKVYLKHINYLNNLPNGLEPIIYQLFQFMNYGNEIIINSAVKRKIAENTGKTFNTINQYITKLVSSDILIRVDTGIYYLNPELYGKGNWSDIIELREKLSITIEYQDGKYSISHNHK